MKNKLAVILAASCMLSTPVAYASGALAIIMANKRNEEARAAEAAKEREKQAISELNQTNKTTAFPVQARVGNLVIFNNRFRQSNGLFQFCALETIDSECDWTYSLDKYLQAELIGRKGYPLENVKATSYSTHYRGHSMSYPARPSHIEVSYTAKIKPSY